MFGAAVGAAEGVPGMAGVFGLVGMFGVVGVADVAGDRVPGCEVASVGKSPLGASPLGALPLGVEAFFVGMPSVVAPAKALAGSALAALAGSALAALAALAVSDPAMGLVEISAPWVFAGEDGEDVAVAVGDASDEPEATGAA